MDRFDSTVAWGAIVAGGVTAAAVSLIVGAFGVGAGLAVVSPWTGDGISPTTVTWSAGLFLLAASVIASTFGGYITGRLRHGWDDVNLHERYFRDTAHGFVTWAFATVLTAAVLGGATTHILAGASAGSIPAAGAAATQGNGGGNVAGATYVDHLLRVEPQANAQAAPGQVAPAQGNDQQATRAELFRLITPATRKGGDVSADDRAYAARLVSVRTGLPQAEAQQRVDRTIADAKNAADKARRAALVLSLWAAAAMIAGALAASLAAAEGGKLRSSRWYDEDARVTTTTVRRA